MAIEAFIMESVSAPENAMATIYTAAEFSTGFFASPLNIIDAEGLITKNQAVHSFLSNYVSALSLLLVENESNFTEFVQKLALAISPASVDTDRHGGTHIFANQRWTKSEDTAAALLSNPMTACLAILRINVEKLLLITKPLGEYKTSLEEQKT